MTSDDEELSALIRAHATRHRAGDALRASVRTQVALADAGREAARPTGPARRAVCRLAAAAGRLGAFGRRAAPAGFGWRATSVGFAFGVALALLAPPMWRVLDADRSLGNELVFDHVRALQTGPLVQVASSDRHTVKPWFQGRIDYAPTVFDLKDEGFPLVGGRVDRIDGRPTAVLTYVRRLHVIDVFVQPAEHAAAPTHELRRGYHVVHWSDSSMQYWIVSGVDYPEIERFVQAWRARQAAP